MKVECTHLLLAFPSQEPLSVNAAFSLNMEIIFLGVWVMTLLFLCMTALNCLITLSIYRISDPVHNCILTFRMSS